MKIHLELEAEGLLLGESGKFAFVCIFEVFGMCDLSFYLTGGIEVCFYFNRVYAE